MYKDKIVRGDIFEKNDGNYVIITDSKEESLSGRKFNPAKPRNFHHTEEKSLEREDLVEKYGHLSKEVIMKYVWENPQIPEWIKWIATNENGDILGFTNKPILEKCSLGWESSNENIKAMSLSFLKPFEGNWEESLEQRAV